MPKINVSISTNKVCSECTDSFTVDDEVWDDMSQKDKEEVCFEAAMNFVEWTWQEE